MGPRTSSLFINGQELEKSQWNILLDNVISYQDQLESTSRKFKLTYEHCHKLVQFIDTHQENNKLEDLINFIRSRYFEDYKLNVINTEASEDSVSKTFIGFKKFNNEWL